MSIYIYKYTKIRIQKYKKNAQYLLPNKTPLQPPIQHNRNLTSTNNNIISNIQLLPIYK